MLLDFKSKLAVVTGGANGIGLTVARLLRSSGAEVWVFDLEKERPEEVAASFGAFGTAVDVTDRASLEAGFAQSGAPDVLIANAGVASFSGMTETTQEDWDRVIGINLSGMFHTVQIGSRLMKERRKGS